MASHTKDFRQLKQQQAKRTKDMPHGVVVTAMLKMQTQFAAKNSRVLKNSFFTTPNNKMSYFHIVIVYLFKALWFFFICSLVNAGHLSN